MAQQITYGIGGYDESMPNNNIIEVIELPDPEPTPEELARESAMAKLLKLGLTIEEVNAIQNGINV
jgi:hypothetical protein